MDRSTTHHPCITERGGTPSGVGARSYRVLPVLISEGHRPRVRFPITTVAKHSRRRSNRRKGFVALPFEASITLDTLADNTVIKANTITFGEDIFVLSVDGVWSIRGQTANEGPISVGYAHSDLSVAEIKEALDASLTDPDDIIAKERTRRPVRRVGSFRSNLNNSEVLDDGKVIRTKIKFSVGDSHSLAFYAQNRSGGVLTTGAIILLEGVIYGRWQR